MGFAVSGLFFLKYWMITRDRLFAFLAAAFWLLAVQRVLFVLLNPSMAGALGERQLPFYLIRLAAFLLILGAIVDRSRRQRK